MTDKLAIGKVSFKFDFSSSLLSKYDRN